MSLPLILASLWAIAATGVALLPMRFQYAPGLALLVAAPVLLVWIGFDQGPWAALFAALPVLSMFRRPLLYFGRKLLRGPET